jgi:hypothetical protein
MFGHWSAQQRAADEVVAQNFPPPRLASLGGLKARRRPVPPAGVTASDLRAALCIKIMKHVACRPLAFSSPSPSSRLPLT